MTRLYDFILLLYSHLARAIAARKSRNEMRSLEAKVERILSDITGLPRV